MVTNFRLQITNILLSYSFCLIFAVPLITRHFSLPIKKPPSIDIYLLCLLSLRYSGYRENTYPYRHSKEYWNLIAARLAFVVVFHFVVHSITSMIAWIIPDVPENLKFKQEREKQVVKEKLGVPSDDEEESEDEDVEDETDKTDRPEFVSGI